VAVFSGRLPCRLTRIPANPRRYPTISHIVEIKTEVRDEQAVRAACSRLKLHRPTHRIAKLFSASVAGLS
jgi:hypothetical protein